MSTLIQLSGGGGSVNPTSGVFPINDGGVFADSSLSWVANIMGVGPVGIKDTFNPLFGSAFLYDLYIDPLAQQIFVGLATSNYMGAPYVYSGIATDSGFAEAIIGAGIGFPTQGVFRASGANALIQVGASPSNSIGFGTALQSFHIGSGLASSAPLDPINPVQWIIVTNELLQTYKLPLYQ
jgi:hypothetical protein